MNENICDIERDALAAALHKADELWARTLARLAASPDMLTAAQAGARLHTTATEVHALVEEGRLLGLPLGPADLRIPAEQITADGRIVADVPDILRAADDAWDAYNTLRIALFLDAPDALILDIDLADDASAGDETTP